MVGFGGVPSTLFSWLGWGWEPVCYQGLQAGQDPPLTYKNEEQAVKGADGEENAQGSIVVLVSSGMELRSH